MNQANVEAALIEIKLERQYSRAFKVYRWSDQFQPEAWMWLPIPTYPNCEHGPFPTKEEAKQAGEEAGYRFEGYEE